MHLSKPKIATAGFFLFILVFQGFGMAGSKLASSLHYEPGDAHFQQLAIYAEEEIQELDREIDLFHRANLLLRYGWEKPTTTTFFAEHLQENFPSGKERFLGALRRIEMQHALITKLQEENRTFGPKSIHIDLSSQRMTIVQDGKILSQHNVSSGAPDTPTPTGNFAVRRKQWLRISNQETPYRMPFYLAFTEDFGYGIHALPYLGDHPWSDDYWQEAFEHIGIPVSHGCVRLLPEEAKMVYDWADEGTPVHITL